MSCQEPEIQLTNGDIGGIILAGGQSRRMGQSKLDLFIGSETLLQRVVRLTGEVVSPVVVAAASHQTPLRLPKTVQVVTDTIPDAGPLVGLLSGLRTLEPICEAAFVVACDQPLISGPVIQGLIDALRSHAAVIVEHEGQLHPLTGVYRTNLAPVLAAYLDQGNRTAREFAKSVYANIINEQTFAHPESFKLALCNINTPEDYAMLQHYPGITD